MMCYGWLHPDSSTIAETVEKNVFSVLMGEKQSDVFKVCILVENEMLANILLHFRLIRRT